MPVEYVFDEEEADLACLFFEKCLVHVKGEWANQPLILSDWQANEIVRPLFGNKRWDPVSGRYLRQYRTVYAEVPRKNAKSTLGGGIALKCLFADKEHGGEVYSAAGDRLQAGIVFDMAKQMVIKSPRLSKMAVPHKSNISYPKLGSFYRAISSAADTKHGFNASCIIFDEVHTQPNRELWDVLTTSVASRLQPIIFAITTAGTDRNSLCWELHEYARKVKAGIIEDPTFLPVLYYAEQTDDWTDPKVWHKANPGLGISVKLNYLEQKCEEAKTNPLKENTFRRLHLNQWTSQESRYIPMIKWDAITQGQSEAQLSTLDPYSGDKRICFGGLDLSKTTDLTALTYVFPRSDDPKLVDVLCRFWLPEDGMNLLERGNRDQIGNAYQQWVKEGWLTLTPGAVVNYDFIIQQILTDAQKWDIKEIAYDRYGAAAVIHRLDEANIKVIPFAQGALSMNAATNALLGKVLEGTLYHNCNPILRWNADNVVVTPDSAGNIKPDKQKSTQKIDGIVALIMALDRADRMDHNEGTSVYNTENRGLLIW